MCSKIIQRKVDFLKNAIIPFIITVILFMVFLWFYKAVYAINDDLMIESVLSGSFYDIYPYTYYISVPLGTLISALYSMAGTVPWFGIFIYACLFLSVFAIEYAAVVRVKKVRHKLVAVLCACLFVVALFMGSIVMPHYTVVAAILGAAGIVLFMTSANEQQFVAPIVFFIFSYLVRENVFFMLVPFVGIAFIYLLITNRGCNIKGYLIYALGFFAAAFMVILLNRALLSSDEWKNYREFNDIRTEVYDYVGIIQSDEAYEYYEQHGYSKEYMELIISYDILLSDTDKVAGALETVADYAHMKLDEMGTKARLKEALVTYRYRMVPRGADFPYNYLVAGMYVVAFVLIVINRRWFQLIPLILCGIYRSAIWMYLMYRGRYPERVTLSLFIMELALLACIVARSVHMTKSANKEVNKKAGISGEKLDYIIKHIAIVGVMLAFMLGSILSVKKLNEEYKTVTDTNSADDVLYSYMYGHLEDYYFLDVYTTVARTKPVLEVSSFSPENYLLLGGWMIEHPLCNDKLEATGYESVCEALRSDSRFHIVVRNGVSASKEQLTEWVGADAVLVDCIESFDATFYVYSFCE